MKIFFLDYLLGYLLLLIFMLSFLFLLFIVLYFLFRSLKVIKISDGKEIKYVVERSFLSLFPEYLEYSNVSYSDYTIDIDMAIKYNYMEDAQLRIKCIRGNINSQFKKIK